MTLLKKARLRSPLSLEDVRVILNVKCHATLSRMELGKRSPSLEVIVGYHVLFNIPIQDLLLREIEQMKTHVEGYVEYRKNQLSEKSNSMAVADRLVFLEEFGDDVKN